MRIRKIITGADTPRCRPFGKDTLILTLSDIVTCTGCLEIIPAFGRRAKFVGTPNFNDAYQLILASSSSSNCTFGLTVENFCEMRDYSSEANCLIDSGATKDANLFLTAVVSATTATINAWLDADLASTFEIFHGSGPVEDPIDNSAVDCGAAAVGPSGASFTAAEDGQATVS